MKFGWGTARIQQALMNLPGFMREKLKACVQGTRLSRTAINGVLKEYGLNGYGREQKAWKFFYDDFSLFAFHPTSCFLSF